MARGLQYASTHKPLMSHRICMNLHSMSKRGRLDAHQPQYPATTRVSPSLSPTTAMMLCRGLCSLDSCMQSSHYSLAAPSSSTAFRTCTAAQCPSVGWNEGFRRWPGGCEGLMNSDDYSWSMMVDEQPHGRPCI